LEEDRALALPPKHYDAGRPWIEKRRVPEGILRIVWSGGGSQDPPEKYPYRPTCWRQSQDSEAQGLRLNMWRTFLNELIAREQLEFHSREKEVRESEKPSWAGGRTGWW